MNKQYAYGPWKPVKDFVQTKQNIQVKFGNTQTRAPGGHPRSVFDLHDGMLYREVYEIDSSWTLNTGKQSEVSCADERNFELYFDDGVVISPRSLTGWKWGIADGENKNHRSILAWRRIGEKPQEKQEFQFVCNENTIVNGILSKEGAKALLKLHEDCQRQCNLLGIPYDADHSLIKQGAEYSYTLGDYLEFQKLGVELFVDNKVKVEA